MLSFDALSGLELKPLLELDPSALDPLEFESVELALDELGALDLLAFEASLLMLEPLLSELLSGLALDDSVVFDPLAVEAIEQLVPEFATLELALDPLLFDFEVDEVPVVQVVNADDSFTEVAADDADLVAPSTSETSLGHPFPAPVALGITDFPATELWPDTTLGLMLDDFITDFGSGFSLAIMRSGFSGTPNILEPRRLPNDAPGAKAESALSESASSLDNLVTTLLLFGEVDSAAEERAEPAADASLGAGVPDLLTGEEAHFDTAEPLACPLLALSFESFFSFARSLTRPALDPSKPILYKR